tara:strand:- start:282 stop:1298 length:1017 start_codon:yes stop_codon:yes gene_type:complete
MFDQFFFLSQSFWIFIAQSIISFFNPAGLDQDAKIKLIESGLDTGIIYLRTQGFEATYDEFNANINNNSIEIKDIIIKKQLNPGSVYFCEGKNIQPKTIWHPRVCEINIKIDKLTFSGLNFDYKSELPFKIAFENINFDLSIFNDANSKTFKKLFEINESISANFSMETKYEFSKNIFHNNVHISLDNFGTIDTNVIFKNIIYSEEFFSLNLDTFSFALKNNSVIEKVNLILDIEGNSNLYNLTKNKLQKKSSINVTDQNELDKINKHNDIINSIEYHYPAYSKNLDDLLSFLQNAKNIKCSRNNDHLMNAEVIEEINRTGPSLLFAVLCENIISNSI